MQIVRFRWISCRLEVLRHCLPPSVRPTLTRGLPDSLDMTCDLILKEIKKPNMRLAQRVLQCLVVAVRSLRIEELAEVLAVEFDDAEGIPRLKPDWRWEEQELTPLLVCSSLISIVEGGDSRVVQFSHFSVKEFLTSPRLATASGEVSKYHINLEPTHTINHTLRCGSRYAIQTPGRIVIQPSDRSYHTANPPRLPCITRLWIPRSHRAFHYQASAGCEC